MTGTGSFALSYASKSIDYYQVIPGSPYYSLIRSESTGSKAIDVLAWVRGTDFYIGAKTNNKIIRGQISATNQSADRNFGGNPKLKGYFDNGTISCPLIIGSGKIKFVDHVGVQTGGVLYYLDHDTGVDIAASSGYPGTDYYFNVPEELTEVYIYEYHPTTPPTHKTITIPGIAPLTKNGTEIPNSSLLLVHISDTIDKIIVIDYTLSSGNEITGIYNTYGPPTAMAGLHSFNYAAIGYSSPGLDLRFGPYNTRMWFEDINGQNPRTIEVAADDSVLVYVDDSDNVVILTELNFTQPP